MRTYTVTLFMLLQFMQAFSPAKSQLSPGLHSFKARDIEGNRIDFGQFKGKKLLLVNTASKCGFTPQFEQLQALYEKYKDNSFTVIGFPSNDFANQDPGTNSEIEEFCRKNYNVSFLMMEKIHVKGDSIHPIYFWLTHKSENGKKNSKVKWNFQKYMIDEEGQLVDYVSSWRKPNCRKITRWIKKN